VPLKVRAYYSQQSIEPQANSTTTFVFGANWGIEMLFEEDFQHAFKVAHGLHPIREIAWKVTRAGIRNAKQKLADQNRRPPSTRENKQRFPFRNALLAGVFAASEIWERDQDSRQPAKTPLYKPTNEDDFMRYIKNLIWHSMDRNSEWVSIAIGHFLFRYSLEHIARLSEYFDRPNTSRTKKFIFERIEDRFHWNLVGATSNPNIRNATEQEFQFVQQILAEFAPLADNHPNCCPASTSLLETYLFPDSQVPEADRIHALINSECAGWARFVDEFNGHPSTSIENRLPDPRDQLRVPIYVDSNSGLSLPQMNCTNQLSIQERFNPDPLTAIELISLTRGVM
jgi:hypothetical protein